MNGSSTYPPGSMLPVLSWYVPGKVLRLYIPGDYSLEDSRFVNALILRELDQSQDDLILLIDATQMNRPYNFDQIRATQTYQNHPKLKYIYTATADRVVKLGMLIIFNISRAQLHLADTIDEADRLLNTRLNPPG